ncbi:MAG: hypothetical protein M5R42_12830 [Rhodocyclaceae bacterium]|nr:hypothetical protein [Rhodocyclaceae bacterium]
MLTCLMVLVNVRSNMLGGDLLHRHFGRGNLIAFASLVTGLSGVGIFSTSSPTSCATRCLPGTVLRRRADPASGAVRLGETARARQKRIGTLQGLFIQWGQARPSSAHR